MTQKKYRHQQNKFVVEGDKLVFDAVNTKQSIEMIVMREDRVKDFDLRKFGSIPIFTADKSTVKDLSTQVNPSGLLAVVDIPRPTSDEDISNQRILFLDGINDPGNLGTIIRTADWFGFNRIYMAGNTVDPYNNKCVQASMGAIYNVLLKSVNIRDLKAQFPNHRFIGADMYGKTVNEIEIPDSICLVIGSESHGISEEVRQYCDQLVKIPGTKTKIAESLNAGVASAILCYVFSNAL